MSTSDNLLQQAIDALPIPELWKRLGIPGEPHIGRKLQSPLRDDDDTPSFSIFAGGKAFKDHGTGTKGSSYNFFQHYKGLDSKKAFIPFVELAGLGHLLNHRNGGPQKTAPTFEWSSLQRLNQSYEDKLAKWRGYSSEFVAWLVSQDLVRIIDLRGTVQWTFPVMKDGNVRGCHHRPMSSDGEKVDWRVYPTNKEGGPGMQPLVIGDLSKAIECHTSESTWDTLSACDKLGVHRSDWSELAFFCTRGASNGGFVQQIPPSIKVFVWMQNDAPAEEWLAQVRETLRRPFYRVDVPEEFKDLNDWTRAGATTADLANAQSKAKLIEVDPLDEPGQSEEAESFEWLKPKKVSELTTVQPEQVLRGMLYQKCKMVLMGGSKSFKTWTLMDIAYCVANGLLWWGIHTKNLSGDLPRFRITRL